MQVEIRWPVRAQTPGTCQSLLGAKYSDTRTEGALLQRAQVATALRVAMVCMIGWCEMRWCLPRRLSRHEKVGLGITLGTVAAS
jgi:hypothetical protein